MIGSGTGGVVFVLCSVACVGSWWGVCRGERASSVLT